MLFGLGLCLFCQKTQLTRVVTQAAPAPTAVQLKSTVLKKFVQAQRIDKTWATKFKFSSGSFRTEHSGIRSYEIDVEYPTIEEVRTRATLKFNRWMKKKIMGYVSEFKRLQRRAEVLDRSRKLRPLSINEGLRIWFHVYYSDDELISFRLTHSVMAMGQMHPIDYYETINYDLRRGRPLRERDVFRKGYTRVLSDFSRRHIKENYEMDYTTDEWLKSGTSPRKKNFPNWNIVPEGILISYEDYQIAAHAFGQLELIVPYEYLKGVLRNTAVTKSFVGTGSGADPGKIGLRKR